MSDTRIEIAPKTIALVVGVIGAVWLLGRLTNVVMVTVVALVLAGTFEPIVAWLEHHGLRRGRALVVAFVLLGLTATGLILLMVPPIVSQFLDLIANAPADRERLVSELSPYEWSGPIVKALNDAPLDDLGKEAAGAVFGISTRLIVIVGYVITTLFLAIYLLADPVRSKGVLYALVPRQHHVKLAKILLELKVIVGGYMRGQVITSVAMSLFVAALLVFFDADNALALALFAGIADLIPFVGGYIASTPVVLAVLPHGVVATIVTIVLLILYQEFESRILVPRVYGRVLRLPPAVVVVSLLIGATLDGILGALLALPIAAGIQMFIRELRVELPGEAGSQDEAKKLDERATKVYEKLSEGASAAEAGVVADDVAHIVKRTEEKRTE